MSAPVAASVRTFIERHQAQVEREVREESGLEVVARKVIGVFDAAVLIDLRWIGQHHRIAQRAQPVHQRVVDGVAFVRAVQGQGGNATVHLQFNKCVFHGVSRV